MPPIHIRPITLADAPAFLALLRLLDHETAFMLYEPDERQTTLAQLLPQIERINQAPNRAIFVAATAENDLAGYIAATGGSARRNRHKADLTIGVAREYSGQGLGTRLMQTIETWARAQRLHKLELTVMAHNQAAIALYHKMGFRDEGRQADSLLVDGRYVDELTMGKLLD